MTEIRPMRIPGRWREGFVLDYHTVSSTYIGDNAYGHPMFDTKRSPIGELLSRLKNRSDESVLGDLADTAAAFVKSWNPDPGLLIPVPPSRHRARQPVYLLVEALGIRLDIPVSVGCVIRTKNLPELKNVYDYEQRLRLLDRAHDVDSALVAGRKVLLFDDLYRSGATMNAIAETLYNLGGASEVYALAVTRTRSRL